MSEDAPPLVERIVAALRRAGAPRSAADLAREFLGLGSVTEELAEQLLAPLLDDDPRLRRRGGAWAFRPDSEGAGGAPLATDFAVAFATETIPLAAVSHPRAARYLVTLHGEHEALLAETRERCTLPRPVVSLARTARLAFGFEGRPETIRIAEHVGAEHVEGDDADGQLATIRAVWERMVSLLAIEGITSLGGLEARLEAGLERAELSGRAFDYEALFALDEGPGVYVFRAFDRRVLYVGQSTHLRERVSSYFEGAPRDEKDRRIRTDAHALETHETETGLDAWIEEARLIRALDPALNRQREVGAARSEDGVLALPTPRDPGRAVLYTVADGALVRRGLASGGRARRARAADAALAALGGNEEPAPPRARRNAALVGAWWRSHEGSLFLREGIDGSHAQMKTRLLHALEDWSRAVTPPGGTAPG